MATYEKPDNLVDLLQESVERFGNNLLFGTKNKSNTGYDWITYGEFGEKVDHLRAGMASLGITKGDSVGLIANNCVEWAAAAYATFGLGGRFVPMYEAELRKIWEYIIKDSSIKLLFVSKPFIYEEIKGWVNHIDPLQHIYLIEGEGDNTMEALVKKGQQSPAPPIKPDPEDIACLIYTSGTTGEPKGVLLSHGNLTSDCIAGIKSFKDLKETDRSLSFLPWAHSYGQTVELHTLLRVGGSTGFAESPQTIIDDIKIVKPTYLVAVPKIFNKIYDGITARVEDEGGIKKALFYKAINSAQKKRDLEAQGQKNLMNQMLFNLLDKIVLKKIRDQFGGQMKLCLSSSAAISRNILEFFYNIGIPLYEGYGMTELSPGATLCTPYDCKIGSVGKPIHGVSIKIDQSVVEEGSKDGEVIVYGPIVMKGYHNKPDATKEIMTEDGGLRTGDRGYLDDDGFLYITGRIKEQYKLENGKYVFPASIEEEIKLLPFVEHAMVYGDNRPYNVCVVVPDFEAIKKYGANLGLVDEPEKIIEQQEFRDFVQSEILKRLKNNFGNYEIPKKYYITNENFSVENGLLTQTLKLKRKKVVEKYQDILEEMYNTK